MINQMRDLLKFTSPHTEKSPKQTGRYLYDIYHLAEQVSAVLKGCCTASIAMRTERQGVVLSSHSHFQTLPR